MFVYVYRHLQAHFGFGSQCLDQENITRRKQHHGTMKRTLSGDRNIKHNISNSSLGGTWYCGTKLAIHIVGQNWQYVLWDKTGNTYCGTKLAIHAIHVMQPGLIFSKVFKSRCAAVNVATHKFQLLEFL